VAEPIRFLLDEHMDPDIAAALRACGIDITTTLEQGLAGQDDQKQMERARDLTLRPTR
jgi:hypothetical protein